MRRSSFEAAGTIEASAVALIHNTVARGEEGADDVGDGPLSAQVQLQSAEKSKRSTSEVETEARVEVDAMKECGGVR